MSEGLIRLVQRRTTVVSIVLILLSVVLLPGCGTNTSSPGDASNPEVRKVGFDLDDTLVFSTPAFQRGFSADVDPFSDEFWSIVNRSDSAASCVKPATLRILKNHQRKGHELYVITARRGVNTEPVRDFVSSTFGIPKDHLYFEPDGKTERLKELGVDVYYGDSDSDIKDAREGDIKAVRIQRSPKSNYQEKYNPGTFDERVLEGTASHDC